ncbi:MAG: hypothetical protein PHT07_23260 [Paludibacter sp.]|nr:hypothetical protein [Paludibacter sp.]
MTKFSYIFISLLFAVNFWNLSIVLNVLPPDIILVLSWVWILSGIYFFNYSHRTIALNSGKYKNTAYYILIGVLISVFSAYAFGRQGIMTTLIAQRTIYTFISLPVMLFVQPEEEDIVKALKWISIGTVIVWVLVHFKTDLVKLDKQSLEQFEIEKQDLSSKLEFYVNGIYFVVLYLYIKMNEYIKNFSWKVFIEATLLLAFIFLYQNRSMLIGVVPLFIYSLVKFRSTSKIYILIVLTVLLIAGVIYTSDIWLALINTTQSNLNETDYNRWKALAYYFYEYSHSWFCYIFGNGFPSGGNSQMGNLMWSNFTKGIFASDLGMIGMWVDYGLIPLIAIYSILAKILKHSYYPMYLKFIGLHILFVPTIFHFWANPGISFFVIIIYLHAYYSELNRKSIQDAGNIDS